MGYIFDSRQSPQAIDRQRRISEALMQQGMDTSPIQSPFQGLARIAQAISGNIVGRRADKAANTNYQAEIERQLTNDAWTQKERAHQEGEWAQDANKRKILETLIGGLPEDRRALAGAFPEEYGKEAIGALFPKAGNQPAGIQEYEYAKAQGFPGTFQDWEASKKGGMSLSVDPATGQVTFQQGSNIKPMTEAQSKDTVFSTRAEGASKVFDQVESGLTGLEGAAGNTIGQLPVIGNALKSEGYQKAEQAGQEFLQAILRKDTGAAITAGEQALYGSVYLPAPGDTPAVIEQKRASRTRALNALKAGMTPQAILAQEQALAKGAAQAPPLPEAPKAEPQGGDQYFDEESAIPEGATVQDDNGNVFRKQGNKLVPVQ